MRLVVASFAPASVLIDGDNTILYSLGPIDHYLRFAHGRPSFNLLATSRSPLTEQLAVAIDQAQRLGAPATVKGDWADREPDHSLFSIHVQIADSFRGLLLVTFIGDHSKGTAVYRDEQPQHAGIIATAGCYQAESAADLENILLSVQQPTLSLGLDLEIRFVTHTIQSILNIIPSDVGRPIADLSAFYSDPTLEEDARTVLETLEPTERELQERNGIWYCRRVLPLRTQQGQVEGVVVTYIDMTERRHAAERIEEARREAELASQAKSRFLAAASHDLRQPLQTMALLQSLLVKAVIDDKARELAVRLDETLKGMAGMLNALLDINRIEMGGVQPNVAAFCLGELFHRIREEFTLQAQSKGLELRVSQCSAVIRSDPRLLEQMVRNLLSNAIKYTEKGKVLLGARRRGDALSIEVWDTGIGIAEHEKQAVFGEYYQSANCEQAGALGLGLGLSIVKRLGELMGHRTSLQSSLGQGSIFTIEIDRPFGTLSQPYDHAASDAAIADGHGPSRTGVVLVIEDHPEVRDMLTLLLRTEGHFVQVAARGAAALKMVSPGGLQPDLVLADYDLPNGVDGVELAQQLRGNLHRDVPVIILTGDTSAATLARIERGGCTQLYKPAASSVLIAAIRRHLPPARIGRASRSGDQDGVGEQTEAPVIFVVDDDPSVREALRAVLEDDGQAVEEYATGEAFLAAYRPGREGCLLIDAYLPGIDGPAVLEHLRASGSHLPAVVITGKSDVAMAVHSMKAGASDFIEKPLRRDELTTAIERALEKGRGTGKLDAWRQEAVERLARLSDRQRQIMELVLAGHPSKNIAADLHVSQRTVDNHRAAIMKKTGAKSLPALARLAAAAAHS